MATTPKGIYYPTVDTIMTPLANQFATLAQSVDTALGNVISAGHFTGTDAQRLALAAPSLRKGVTWYTSDTNLMYMYNGSSWVFWARQATPFAMAAGTATVSSNAWTTVTLPASRFSVPPLVVAQMFSGAGSDIGASAMVSNITATSFITRKSNTSGGTIHWWAVQMTPTTAGG